MNRYQEGLYRNYLRREECRQKRLKRASLTHAIEWFLWNGFIMIATAALILWVVIGFKQLAYMGQVQEGAGMYILIVLVAIGIVKVADRWMK